MPRAAVLKDSQMRALAEFQAAYKNRNIRLAEIDEDAKRKKEAIDSEIDDAIVRLKETGVGAKAIAESVGITRATIYNRLNARWPQWRVEEKRNALLPNIERILENAEGYEEFSAFRKVRPGVYALQWAIDPKEDIPTRTFLFKTNPVGWEWDDDVTSFPKEFSSGTHGNRAELLQKAFNWVQSLDTKDSNEYLSELEAANTESRE